MGLSAELISEFVKITNDNKKGKDENTVYGTVSTVSEDGKSGTVKIDGSDEATPFTTTCKVTAGDRVRLTVRNHNAIVTGNTTDISASAAELLEALAKIVKLEKQGVTFDSVVKFVNGLENGTTTIDGGCIDTDTLNLTGCISFKDLTDGDDYAGKIDEAVEVASSAASDVSDITVLITQSGKTKTFIDGSKIATDSVYANSIHLGGSLAVYTSEKGDDEGGYLGYDDGFNSDYGIGIRSADERTQVVCTNNAARLSYGDITPISQIVAAAASATVKSEGKVYINGDDGIIFQMDGNNLACFVGNSFRSYPDGTNSTLGISSQKWKALYVIDVAATTCTGTSSDRNVKNSIEDLPDKYVDMFDRLRPVRYKLNDGTSGRYHVGYIAQEVEEAMAASGIDSLEFGGFVREIDEDGNAMLMLRYGEFDGVRDAKIKQLESRIDELERRLANLEVKEVG